MPVRKLAIFTEGMTEQRFAEALVHGIAEENQVSVALYRAHGGRRYSRMFTQVMGTRQGHASPTHYVQIVDSGTDGRVVTDIVEQSDSLRRAEFEAILGLRDLRPLQANELPLLIGGIERSIAGVGLPCTVAIAVLEIETWLLAEYSHLRRIHRNLTLKRIVAETNVHLRDDNLEDIAQAAELLSRIYALEGRTYDKSANAVARSVEALDQSRLAGRVAQKYEALREFVEPLKDFFAQPA